MTPPERLILPTDGPIVVVDDDAADRHIMSYVLADSNLTNELLFFASGDEVIAHMEAVDLGEHAVPVLILLDVNMPGKTGFDVLRLIRAKPAFCELPIIAMLTSSDAGHDQLRAADLGANDYLAKQSGIDQFVSAIDGRFRN